MNNAFLPINKTGTFSNDSRNDLKPTWGYNLNPNTGNSTGHFNQNINSSFTKQGNVNVGNISNEFPSNISNQIPTNLNWNTNVGGSSNTINFFPHNNLSTYDHGNNTNINIKPSTDFFKHNTSTNLNQSMSNNYFNQSQQANPWLNTQSNLHHNQPNSNINNGHFSFGANKTSNVNFFPPQSNLSSVNSFNNNLTTNSKIDLMNKTNSINFLNNNTQRTEQTLTSNLDNNNDFLGVLAFKNYLDKNTTTETNEKKLRRVCIPDKIKEVDEEKFFFTTTINYPTNNEKGLPSNNTVNTFKNTLNEKSKRSPFTGDNLKIKHKENIGVVSIRESNKKTIIATIKPMDQTNIKTFNTEQKSFANECLPMLNELFKREKTGLKLETEYKRSYNYNKYGNLIKLNFTINESILQDNFTIKISLLHTIGKLKEFLAESLAEKLECNVKPDDFQIISKHSSSRDHELIKDKEFYNENERLIIILEDKFTENFFSSKEQKSFKSFDENQGNKIIIDNDSQTINVNSNFGSEIIENRVIEESLENDQILLNYLPVLNTKNYKTEPKFDDLVRMSKNELENVENFSIYNEFGMILFPGYTDLTYVNLDESINIDFKLITVYQNSKVPKVGQKLNKQAILSFYQFYIDEDILQNDKEFSDYIVMLEDNARKSNVNYI